MRSLFCLLLFFVGVTAVRAQALDFGNAMAQTQWRLEHGRFTCRLVQDIADYGSAELVQRGDGRLSFRVHAMPGLYVGQMTRVALVPAPWQPSGAPQVLTLHSGAAGHPVSLADEAARQVMLAFQGGRFVDLSYPADSAPHVRVRVSSLGFRTALGKLQKCVSKLPPASFSDYAKTTVYFASGSSRLGKAARGRIVRLAGYLKTYGGVRLIIAVGNTDNVGFATFNYRLGERRARSVADLLRAQGVKLPIRVRSYGESRPVDPNSSAAGRARNRRVTITLEH
ncbi:MAG: OmpA family protein [Acidihalobacter sp.]|jgi:sodium-type flagellar protein MotY